MHIDITEILKIIIYLMVALISTFIVPWLRRKLDAQDLDELLKWADIGVAAAEQLYESTQGDVKKKYVLGFLESKGYTMNVDDLNEVIEAAVNRLHGELYGKQS